MNTRYKIATGVALCAISVGAMAQYDDVTTVQSVNRAGLPITVRPDEELLIFELHLEDIILSEGIIVFSNNRQSLLVPLSEIAQLLRFSITVDAREGTATGWFIDENRTFNLDIGHKNIVIAGEQKAYKSELIELHEDDIFVDIALLEKWFPVTFGFSINTQILSVTAKEPLPVQEAIARENARESRGNVIPTLPSYPRHHSPYGLIRWPHIDVNIDSNYDNEAASPLSLSSDLLAVGDVLGMSARTFISTDEDEGISDVRVILERKDPDGGLLGFMNATEVEVGDVFTEQLSLTSEGIQGRGFNISNFPLNRLTEFDRATLRGDLLPGWEVELYRNDILLEFQRSRDDGLYEFNDVPLLPGLNIIRLVFYGPFGEKREEIQRFLVDPDQVKTGKSYYGFSVSQHQKDLVQINEDVVNRAVDGEPRIIAQYEYGLGKSTSLSTHFVSVPLEDEKQHQYVSAGLTSSLFGVLGQMNVARDIAEGGSAFDLTLQTQWRSMSILAEHEHYLDNFISERTENVNDPLTRRTRLSLDTAVEAPLVRNINIGLELEEEAFESTRKEQEINNRLSVFINRTNISHTLRYQVFKPAAGDSRTEFDGDALVSFFHERFSIRGQATYSIEPVAELETVSITGDYDVNEDLGIRAAVNHELVDDGETELTIGLNKTFDHSQWALNGTFEDDGGVLVAVSLSLSLGRNPDTGEWRYFSDPIATGGLVSSTIYIDNDGDKKLSAGDTLVENATLRADGRDTRIPTNAKGNVLLTNLATYQPIGFSLERSSIEDPYLIPIEEGKEIVTRPGTPIKIAFGLSPTGEIDGTVYIHRYGQIKQASNVHIELLNSQGDIVQDTRTAYDGFYLFDNITPGEYTIRISPEQTARLGFQPTQTHNVSIKGNSGIISGVDFTLKTESDDNAQTEELEEL